MNIHHVAIWVKELEKMKEFYIKFFNCKAGNRYHNPEKGFSSYFLSFDNGAKIELMHRDEIVEMIEKNTIGLTHLAISVGNKEEVDRLTNLIKTEGFTVKGYPRTTGDGYYESVIIDPEGNLIEITV